MSDNTVTPENVVPTERTLGQEIARESTIAFAASAAGVVGLVGGLLAISKLADLRSKKNGSNDIEPTPESETTES